MEKSSAECAICLQPMLYPVKLPCSHNFCFLCVKGLRDPLIKRCAMCRQQFSLEQIEQTLELGKDYETKKFRWLYEARNQNDSWWAFDERNTLEIEDAFKSSKDQISINIAGYTYVIDFAKMQQYRYDLPTRIRKIKRQEDNALSDSLKIKGIAGLRVASSSDHNVPSASTESHSPVSPSGDDDVTDLCQTLTSLELEEEI